MKTETRHLKGLILQSVTVAKEAQNAFNVLNPLAIQKSQEATRAQEAIIRGIHEVIDDLELSEKFRKWLRAQGNVTEAQTKIGILRSATNQLILVRSLTHSLTHTAESVKMYLCIGDFEEGKRIFASLKPGLIVFLSATGQNRIPSLEHAEEDNICWLVL